jgi:Tfp pilus assembly protein PilN
LAALNLARRPLVNRRPLQRVVAALWTAAALVLLFDAVVLIRHFTSSSAGNERLVALDREVEQEVASLRQLDRALREFDLREQNRHVEFLNQRIAQRTFPWSQLFEQLGGVLPEGIRLQSLRPAIAEDEAEEQAPPESRPPREGEASRPKRWVQLQIAGEAETDEAILELVDALFRHPAFSLPNLRNEAQDRSGYRFNLSVRYLPDLELPEESGAGESTASRAAAERPDGQLRESELPGEADSTTIGGGR